MARLLRSICRSVVALAIAAAATAQSNATTIGAVDFFGTTGVDVGAVRGAVPVRVGDRIAPDTLDDLHQRIIDAVTRAAGARPTDVHVVCCDARGSTMIYIGLPGRNVRDVPHRAAPGGNACLAADAMRLDERASDAVQKAIASGDATEDFLNGYALSHHPEYRQAQLAMRDYAVAHDASIRAALGDCADAEQRAAAAQLLGYAKRSRAQIDALVAASSDPDRTVRNNAVRALWALASAKTRSDAAAIPAAAFIPLLNSGTWEDRNKAGLLLSVLIKAGDRSLLDQLRASALDSLIEMARWHDRGHADSYRALLGRIAGLDEARLNELLDAGDVDKIVAAVQRR